MIDPSEEFARHITRRTFLGGAAGTLGTAALGSLLAGQARHLAAASMGNGSLELPHFAPKAKHVIYLHMIGAPSQLDLFDYKPVLKQHDGQKCPDDLIKGKRFAFIGGEMTLAGSEFQFRRHATRIQLSDADCLGSRPPACRT